ncbi:MAG: hypothetical protein ACR2PK_15870 [Acidimicrobiales bacterium]
MISSAAPGVTSTLRRPVVFFIVVFAVAVFSIGSAAAQGLPEVPRGDSFGLQNNAECAPSADVVVYLGQVGDQRIGVGVTDSFGHFELDITVPASTPLGEAILTVECAMVNNVLVYDVLIVESTAVDLLSYAPYVAAALAGILIVGSVIGAARRRAARRSETKVEVEATSPAFSLEVPEDKEGDPDYWFWDAETERGSAKRLACLTDRVFYLHEIPESSFNALLEKLAAMGPEDALRSAFLTIPIDDIDEVHHRGTSIRIRYRTESGLVSKTIDLGDGAKEVLGFLSSRVPVVADNESPTPVEAPAPV